MAIPKEILKQIDTLDPLSVTAQRLISLMKEEKEDVSMDEVAEMIEFDQAMASNILRLCNSVLYAGRVPPTNLRAAVVRLGLSKVMEMVLGNYLRRLKVNAPLYDLDEEELWLHSAASSLASKALMKHCSRAGIPDETPVAALVHDIGKLIMVRFAKINVGTVLKCCKENNLTFVEAEQELFGCDHSEVGGAMARSWGFPESIVFAIEHHHHFPTPEGNPILDAVIVANLMTKTIGVGLGAEGMNLRVDFDCHRRLDLDFDGFCGCCAQTTFALEELKKTYQVNSVNGEDQS